MCDDTDAGEAAGGGLAAPTVVDPITGSAATTLKQQITLLSRCPPFTQLASTRLTPLRMGVYARIRVVTDVDGDSQPSSRRLSGAGQSTLTLR